LEVPPSNVVASVILEGEDYGLKVKINIEISDSEGSALPERGGFDC
jgi:hypothetical protein